MLSIEFASSKKPGAAHNEDLFGFKGDTFWLLDGATSTDGPALERDAHWLVNELDAALNALAPKALPVDEMAAAACNRVFELWPGNSSLRPIAALAVWRVVDGALCAAITGNLTLIAQTGNGVIELTDKRVDSKHVGTDEPLFAALARGVSFEAPEFKALRSVMKHQEASGLDASLPNRMASAARRAPGDFSYFRLEVPTPTLVLAATDGFMELRRFQGNPSLEHFMEEVQGQALWTWLDYLRAVELEADSGKRFPRTKRHDDATAAMVQIT